MAADAASDGDAAFEPAVELFKCLRFTRDDDDDVSGTPRPECIGRFRDRLAVVEDLEEDALEAEEDPESESELPDPSPPELESDSDPSVVRGDSPRLLGCC